MAYLMTNTVYWGPPNLRPFGFAGDLEANGPVGELIIEQLEQPVMDSVEADQPVGPIDRQVDDNHQLDELSGILMIGQPEPNIADNLPLMGVDRDSMTGPAWGGSTDIMAALGQRTGAVPKNRYAARIYPNLGTPGPFRVERSASETPAAPELAASNRFDPHTFILHAPRERPTPRYLLHITYRDAAGPVSELNIGSVDVYNQPTIRLSLTNTEESEIHKQPTYVRRPVRCTPFHHPIRDPPRAFVSRFLLQVPV